MTRPAAIRRPLPHVLHYEADNVGKTTAEQQDAAIETDFYLAFRNIHRGLQLYHILSVCEEKLLFHGFDY